jgi:hypothetical protein
MIELVNTADSRAVRNKNNVLALYDLMIRSDPKRRRPNMSAHHTSSITP